MSLTIESDGKGSRELYEEQINISYQYKLFMKRPERKLRNEYRRITIELAAVLIFLLFGIIEGFVYGFETVFVLLIAVCIVFIGIYGRLLYTMRKALRKALEDNRKVVVCIDEEGIKYHKEDGMDLSLKWSQVAFVRVFSKALSFFSDDNIVVSVNRTHEKEVMDYIRENGIKVRVIGEPGFVSVSAGEQ